MTYLFWLVTTLTMSTTHVGFVVAGNNEVGPIYAAQMHWGDDADSINARISSVAIIGLVFGSFAAGFFVK